MSDRIRPEDAGHKNPPLASLNQTYRQDDAKRQGERNEVVDQITGALGHWATPSGKRVQKPITAPAHLKAAG